MGILAFMCFYPFYYVFIYSISDPVLAQRGITLLPAGISFSNYERVFKLNGLVQAFFVSVGRTLIGTVLTVLACSFFAYLMTQRIYAKKIIYRFVIFTMYFNAGLIPWYLTLRLYHLIDTFWVYVIPSAISAYYIVLLKTFMESLPVSLQESARLDGAGIGTVFFRIVLPLSKPIAATITMFAAIAQWNSWFDNYILVQSASLKTLQLMLYDYLNQASALSQMSITTLQSGAASAVQITAQSVRMTITMVVMFPILLVYPLMQRYFSRGILIGSIKG